MLLELKATQLFRLLKKYYFTEVGNKVAKDITGNRQFLSLSYEHRTAIDWELAFPEQHFLSSGH